MKNKRIRKKQMIIISFSILTILVLILGFTGAFNTKLEVTEYSIKSSKLEKGNIRIALVTDLHSCDYGENQKELMVAINKAKVDVVLLGGDIVDDDLPEDKAKDFFSEVTKEHPTYYVTGNHEYYTKMVPRIKDMIRSYGITVLEGDTVEFSVNNQKVLISGVDDSYKRVDEFWKQIKSCSSQVENFDKDTFSILLSHHPEFIETYINYNFNLILSGHAHGGQWIIPKVMNGFISPGQGLFPKYTGDKYDFQDKSLIVSRGLSKKNSIIPRIYNRPELVIIELEKLS